MNGDTHFKWHFNLILWAIPANKKKTGAWKSEDYTPCSWPKGQPQSAFWCQSLCSVCFPQCLFTPSAKLVHLRSLNKLFKRSESWKSCSRESWGKKELWVEWLYRHNCIYIKGILKILLVFSISRKSAMSRCLKYGSDIYLKPNTLECIFFLFFPITKHL